MTIDAWRITGQSQIDSYVGRWAELAVILVNELAVTQARGKPVDPPTALPKDLPTDPPTALPADPSADPPADVGADVGADAGADVGADVPAGPSADLSARRRAALDDAFTRHGWTPSRSLTASDADRLAEVAAELRPAFTGAPGAIAGLNQALVRHHAVPNLHGDPPVLAFHGVGADLVDAWAADATTALAMVIGVGQGVRLRTCEASGCELVFFDVTRNASRRFCGLSCQNRAKASAYRARRRA
ncbi:CGNR zinc finger domain-containing protein [Nonomuraea zeae]|uniref:CGNR zinc finger domain-containing protein n=1 Tax=Nonomuraea zeae TaxID=1642303 RepID=UPI001F0E081E|nr:CGNR zinc finger domain-containing protein [Nonomuraea zeae]